MLKKHFVKPSDPIPYSGERLDPAVYPADILQLHAGRYAFAARYCHGCDVLDVASGLGYGTDYLRAKGARAVGWEIDEMAVQCSRVRYPQSVFVQGTAEKMPDGWDEAYDVVVSFETIEHLHRPDQFLEEVFRCLRPGGLFICSTPNKSLSLFQSTNEFHLKEFYHKEYLKFIGRRFRVIEMLGQSFHPSWKVIVRGLHTLASKSLRAMHIPPLGISNALEQVDWPSPFDENSIVESRVLPQFMPSPIHRHTVPTFLVAVAEKSRK